nr:RNA-dependent RNA polymerase 1-like isoform X3 [Dermatophagoides farinae]
MKQMEDEYNNVDDNEDLNEFSSHLSSFSIGSLLNLSTFVKHLQSSPTSISSGMKMEIDFFKSCLNFYFIINHYCYKMEIRFGTIKYILIDKNYNLCKRFYLELNAAPFLFINNNSNRYIRVADFSASFSFSPEIDDPYLLGNALSYQIDVYLQMNKAFSYLCYRCKEINPSFQLYIGLVQECHIIEKKFYTMKEAYDLVDGYFSQNFRNNYACRVLLSKSYKVIDFLGPDLPTFIARLQTLSNQCNIEPYLFKLSVSCNSPIFDISTEFDQILEDGEIKPSNESVNEDVHVMIRKAILTPTRLEYCRQMPMLRSRFSNMANLDYAIRFTILEDNNGVLNSNSDDTIQFHKKTFKKKLEDGFLISNRDYQFLGASPSQMRENGINFYAKDDENRTAETIIANAGNLKEYARNPSKLMARLGLLFSQAIIYHDLSNANVVKTEEIYSEDKKYCFSDGCGLISETIAIDIAEKLPNLFKYVPSAFQFRHGGHKGVLVSYQIKDNHIIYRDSQIKYKAEDPKLGILSYSYPRPVHLCRSLINILYQKGVKETLYKYFNRDTKIIMEAMLTNESALKLLNHYPNFAILFDKLLDSGFSLINEPFLRTILQHVMIFRLKELKTKARVKIPESNGRSAFGVLDETKQLNSGEMFFQYSILDNDGVPTGKTKIIEGEIMVTKFPCTSMGDVRKFKAVNVPDLKHIKDCLVFPAKGNRPHTDEMAGSDLDGDEYAIFWDDDLIFPGKNHEPLDFESHQRPDLANIVKASDMIDFYIEFLTESNLGRIANCHLMFADFHPQGLLSGECIELAKEYSKSLDFQKNGINAKLEREYNADKQFIRPDFMSKLELRQNNYLSRNILGEFYRQCCLIENIVLYADELSPDLQEYIEPQKELILPGWEKYKTLANNAFKEYYYRIVETMETMGIASEAAFLSDLYEKRPEVATYLSHDLSDHIRGVYARQSAGKNPYQKHLLTSAWYAICFEKSTLFQYHYKQRPLLGLPFMISNELINLAYYINLNKSVEPIVTTDEDQSSLNKMIQFSYQECIDWSTKFILCWMEKFQENFFKNYKNIENLSVKFDSKTPMPLRLFLAQYIHDVIDSIAIKKSFKKDEDHCYQDIFYLIDEFFRHLHSLCNEVNTFIIESKIEQILLLPYALFASKFIGHIGSSMSDVSNETLLNITKADFIDMNLKHINRLFNNIIMRKEKLYRYFEFSILDQRYFNCFLSLNEKDKLKWKILTGGLKDIKIPNKYDRKINGRNSVFGWNLKKVNLEFITIKTRGLQPSITLLKLLIGHPHFYEIFTKLSFDHCFI